MTDETPAPAMAAETDDEELEQPFVGYDVVEKISQGGMGAVFRAVDGVFGRDVAIKALIPDLEHNEDAVEQFFSEARNVARLRHPHIVRGYDVGRAGEYFYFVMEYVRGEALSAKLERLERSRLPEARTLPIVRQIAEALQYIFENGLVHRDIKPGNILLGESDAVKLCDLGVAREVAYATPESCVKGSPSYASPEQARGDLDVDIRADLYGLGCTWFHMLTGRPPFTGQTPAEILHKQVHEEAPNVRDVDIRLTAATSQLVSWLLKKDRDDRPRTPQAFLAKLQSHPMLAAEEGGAETDADASAPADTGADEASLPDDTDEDA